MNRIVRWWAANRVAANLLMAALFISGLIGVSTIHREVNPYADLAGAQVLVTWPGASPQDIERQVIVRLEEAIASARGVDQIWSESRRGYGVVYALARSGVDQDALLDELARAANAADRLPVDAEQPRVSPLSTADTIVRVAISGETPPLALNRFARDVRNELAALPGVAEVALNGARREQIVIEIAHDDLVRYGLTFDDVAASIRRASVESAAGEIITGAGDMRLAVRRLAKTAQDFDNIVLRRGEAGAVVRLRDVARVDDTFEEEGVFRARLDGAPAIMAEVKSGPGVDIVAVSHAVSGYVAERRQGAPPGIELAVWSDAAETFSARLSVLSSNFITGLMLVFAALALFLRPAIALWVVVGVAAAFAGAFAILPALGVSLNILSIFAFLLVVGVIVDDAIIVGESIHAKMEEGRKGLAAAVEGVAAIRTPVIFAVLSTIVFFAPWAFVGGGFAAFTQSISIVVCVALIFSLVEAFLILPSHLSALDASPPTGRLGKAQRAIAAGLSRFAARRYRPLAAAAIKRPWLTVSVFAAAVIVCSSLVSGGFVKTSFFPTVDSDRIVVTAELRPDAPRSDADRLLDTIERGVDALRAELNDPQTDGADPVGSLFATLSEDRIEATIRLNPDAMATLSPSAAAMRLSALIGDVREARTFSVETRAVNAIPEIQYVLNADDEAALNAAARALVSALKRIDGVQNAYSDAEAATPELRFSLRPAAEALGLGAEDAARQLRQGFYGEEAQRLPRDGEDVRVLVRLAQEERRSLDFLGTMRIRTEDGGLLPLSAAAEIERAASVERILRRDRKRAIMVSAEAAPTDVARIRAELEDTFFAEFEASHPLVERGDIGLSEAMVDFVTELAILGVIAFGVAYFLLAVAFQSYGQPFLILFAAIPLCFAGALAGHWLFDIPLSAFSALGFMAAAGVAVNDNLVLLDHANKRLARGASRDEALIDAGVRRFRPIVIMSLTTVAGLAPILFDNAPAARALSPVAVGLVFGVLFSLPVSLLLVPALFKAGAEAHARARARMRRAAGAALRFLKGPALAAKQAARADSGLGAAPPPAEKSGPPFVTAYLFAGALGVFLADRMLPFATDQSYLAGAIAYFSAGGAILHFMLNSAERRAKPWRFLARLFAIIISPLIVLAVLQPNDNVLGRVLEAHGVGPVIYLIYLPVLIFELYVVLTVVRIGFKSLDAVNAPEAMAAEAGVPEAVARLAAMEAKMWRALFSLFKRKAPEKRGVMAEERRQ